MAPQAKPQAKAASIEQRITNIERLLKWLGGFSGVSLVMLLGFAYWLGGINSKVSTSQEVLKQMSLDVSGKDGLLVRTKSTEDKLGTITDQLKSMDVKLDTIRNQTLRERTTVVVRAHKRQ